MPARLQRQPLIVQMIGIMATAMLVPGAHAIATRDWDSARAFFYSSLIFLSLFAMLAIALANRVPRRPIRSNLLALVAAYLGLPLMLAVPFYEAVGDTRFLNAYFEMVSSFTTTGATLYDEPGRLTGTVHLWRALVGWLGGFFVWVTAIAILAPLNLGGFEVLSMRYDETGAAMPQIARVADAGTRLRRYAAMLFPIYAILTLILWVGLLAAGDLPLVAASHAMSTLSTSGISPVGGTEAARSGIWGEMFILLFFGFALSRRTFEREGKMRRRWQMMRDPEIRMGLGLAVLVALFLFLRHWLGAIEVEAGRTFELGLKALWGGFFTVVSFMSTTGFQSAYWEAAQSWSGLSTPGLVLMGLALVGGGVATTAGGVKLLRVYALYKHSLREMDRLIHPNSIGGQGAFARHLRRRGAYIAWIFFMLFAMSICVVMLALSVMGIKFEPSVVLTIAALSNTGPLATLGADVPLSYAALTDAAKMILALSMVLGRLETLAIIALLNPDLWRS